MSTDALLPPVPAGAPAAAPALAQQCENCGNAVAQRYCGACGQRREPPVHSLWHFSRVATEDLTHADSRLWRTLGALLFRPGYLTAEFLAGRRARYLPPLRLYLVLSVVFFVFTAATQPQFTVMQIDADHPSRAQLADLDKDGADAVAGLKPKSGETLQQRSDRLCGNATYAGPWAKRIAPMVPAACRKVVEDNGAQLREAFLHNVPRAMFVFLPLLAGFMMLMYWRPRHYYVEHLLLLVHNHAFVFLVVMLAWLVAKLLPGIAPAVKFAVVVYFAWYMLRSMRVAYRQGRALTLGKLTLLFSFYLVCGVFMLVLTSFYSALTL